MVQQDHGRLNQRQGQRRDGRLQNRLHKIANGQIGQVIRHVQRHAEMEAKAELESVKIFREDEYHAITDVVDLVKRNIFAIMVTVTRQLRFHLLSHPLRR